METIDTVEDIDSLSVENLKSSSFIPYSDTSSGQEYFVNFMNYNGPPPFSKILVQYALTELLNLRQDQLQKQMERLCEIGELWFKCYREFILLENKSNSQDSIKHFKASDGRHKWQLSSLEEQFLHFEEYNIILKNIPFESDKIFFNDDFERKIIIHMMEKIDTIRFLVKSTKFQPNSEKLIDILDFPIAFFKPDTRPKLILTLSQYINNSQTNRKNLDDVINGKQILTHIIVNCSQVKLGSIFYQEYMNDNVTTSKVALAKWICLNFKRNVGAKIVDLSESSINRHLKGIGLPKDKY